MVKEADVLDRICQNCHAALYYPIEHLPAWVRCESCGHCKPAKKKQDGQEDKQK